MKAYLTIHLLKNSYLYNMKPSRKIALVVNQVRMDDEDQLDVLFWLDKLPSERLAEVSRLRKNYFTSADGESLRIYKK